MMVHGALDQDYSNEHPFLSYAKQVSFPRWNVMVGELGHKFTRHSSIEKEAQQQSEATMKQLRNDYEVASKPQLDKRTHATGQLQKWNAGSPTEKDCGIAPPIEKETNDGTNVEAAGRQNIFRYCEIITEVSSESDEECVDTVDNEEHVDNEEGVDTRGVDNVVCVARKDSTANHVSSIKITLKRTISDPNATTPVQGVSGNNQPSNNMQPSNNTDQTAQESYKAPNTIGWNIGKEDAASFTVAEKDVANQASKTKQPLHMLNRAPAFDDSRLAPLAERRHKSRFRKKSSSFSGVLPIRIEVTADKSPEMATANAASSSPAAMRRRGTIDMGRVVLPKSPKLLKSNSPKRADPSHYLMQSMGRRRGSYNPTYDQSKVTLTRTRSGHNRAKSVNINHKDDKHSLRERLMKHASPELRESLELNESDEAEITNKNQNETGSSNKYQNETGNPNEHQNEADVSNVYLNEKQRHNDGQLQTNGGLSSGELTRRKISLAKSASFDSFAGLLDGKHDQKNYKAIKKHLHSRNSNAPNQRRTTRKSPVFDTVAEKDTLISDENRSMEISVSDNELKSTSTDNQGQYFRTRGRNMRAQSSFDGVAPTYLGRLRQKNADHLQLARCKSDSMSSMSSSEGSDVTDPFPVHYAAKYGKLKQLQKMITTGKNVNALDADGWPAIHYALTAGNFECVACLLNAGANITDYARGRTSKYFK